MIRPILSSIQIKALKEDETPMNEVRKSIFKSLLSVQFKLNTNLEKIAGTMNINRTELLVLLDVIDYPDTSLNDLCQRKGIKKSAASKIVDKLVEREYINRSQCRTNRREVSLAINASSIEEGFCTNQVLTQVFSSDEIFNQLETNVIIEALNILENKL